MNPTTRKQGQQAEKTACKYLEAKGLELYHTNYCCRHGEIDLIMGDSSTLVFVEVRYRSSSRFGSGAETIDRRKQMRIIAAAAHYPQMKPEQARRPARFDVVVMQQRT